MELVPILHHIKWQRGLIMKVDVLIVGAGAAGLASAYSAKKEGAKSVLVLEKGDSLGGILNQCIHSGFGLSFYKEELTGPEFAERLAKEALEEGFDLRFGASILSLTKDKTATFIDKEGFHEVQFKSVILAAGSYERSAGAIALPGARIAGVLTAGQAQQYLNYYGLLPGKRCFILGSGDIGLIMARRLTLEGAKVLGVAEICPYSNGLRRNIVQCLDDFSIPLYLSTTVSKVFGTNRLEGIELSKVNEKKEIIPNTEKVVECDALILSVGLIPNNQLYDLLQIRRNGARGSAVDEHNMTELEGFFAAGNALHVHDLVDHVAEEGISAGKWAARYANNEYLPSKKKIEVRAGEGISYLLPSYLRLDQEEESLSFLFRVKNVEGAGTVLYRLNGEIIHKVNRPFLLPSEMEKEKVPFSLLKGKEGVLEVSYQRREG